MVVASDERERERECSWFREKEKETEGGEPGDSQWWWWTAPNEAALEVVVQRLRGFEYRCIFQLFVKLMTCMEHMPYH